MTLSMIGGHFTANGIGANYPSRVCLSIQGNGLGEQHPDTIVLFRDVTVYMNGPGDLHTKPNRRTIEYAQFWYDQLRPIWQTNAHRAHYFTITNELGGSNPEHIKDHIAFESHICQLAHADGLKCAVGKLAGDSPDWNTNLWQELYAPHIMSMWDRYGAVYARHVYGGDLVDSNGVPTNDPPGNPQRAIFEAYHLRRLGYGGGMVLAECGLDGGYGVADYGRFRAQALGYEAALRAHDDIIIGLCWWKCGNEVDESGSGFDSDYTEHIKMLRPSLDTSLPKWEGKESEDMEPKDCDLYMDLGRFVHLLPQDTTDDEIATIARKFNASKQSFVYSHDDAELVVAHGRGQNSDGKKVSEVKIWEPQRFSFDVTGYFASRGYKYTVDYFSGSPPAQWAQVNVPHMSQFGGGADARSNDCGAAAVAMVVNGQTANRPTVDAVATAYQSPPNEYMNFSQLDTALNGYGMDGLRKQPYTPPQISADIVSGKAVIALVWYQSLPYKFSNFNGSHFIVMYATNKTNAMRYRDPLCPDGRTLEITYDVLEKAMRDAQNTAGNAPNQGMVCSVKSSPPPTGRTVDMLPYFSPPAGTPYGPVTIKDTNWGQGQVRQQIQAHGDYLYVTKGKEFEARQLTGDRIFLIMDNSPGGGKYYTVQSADGWIPRHFTEGQSFTRKETATFFYNDDCSETGEESNWTNVIRFTKFYPTWATPGGMSFSNVCHLQWLVGGVVEEDYFVAPHVGYAMWQNRHGRQSYVVSMPQGQGNNTFDGACYWPAFGKEW